MYLYEMNVYLFPFIIYAVAIRHSAEGYPSHDVERPLKFDLIEKNGDSLYNIKDADVFRVRSLFKRDILNPFIQLPEGNKTSVVSPSNTPEGKPKSVKKELKDEKELKDTPLNSTDLAVNLSNGTLLTSNKDVAATPSQKTNSTESPPPPQTVELLPTPPPKSSTPSIENRNNVTTESGKNVTLSTTDSPETQDGAKKRGLIVFGTLGVFSAAYLAYKIYKRKKQQRNNDLSFYPNDNQQFKYGVLMSHENDDNLELSNIPQTIDSDDEEIEIFDLENKKFVDNERNNSRFGHPTKDELLEKDDVEILDLNLPGTSDSDPLRSSIDDNLLNFDDIQQQNDTLLQNSQKNESFKNKNPNDFFDIL